MSARRGIAEVRWDLRVREILSGIAGVVDRGSLRNRVHQVAGSTLTTEMNWEILDSSVENEDRVIAEKVKNRI